MKNKKNNKKRGFTLIEILVVVLIIGVLAAIALPSYMRSVERSRAAGPMTNLGSIAKAQNRQRLATMHYTDNVGNLDISLKDETNGEDATGSTFESEFFTYKVYGDDKAVATATRKDVSEDKQYELSVDYNTNKIYCRPIENKTCIDLGLEEGQDYADSDDGDWQNCLDNISGLASMVGMEGYEAELAAMVNEYYPEYCKIRGNEYRVCVNEEDIYYCVRGKYDTPGCELDEFCLSSGSNLGECQGEREYGASCYIDQGNNVQLTKTCVDIDEENFECNNWQNERLYWSLNDGQNSWECEGDGIAADGRSCDVYSYYRIANEQHQDLVYCGTPNYGDGRIVSTCSEYAYSEDGHQILWTECFGDTVPEVYEGGQTGSLNANHTGCTSYAYYTTYTQGSNGQYYTSLQCSPNGTCTTWDEDGNWQVCTANAQNTGCAE